MKKLLLFVFIASSLSTFGQIREKGDIELSPFIGYSSSFLNGDDADSDNVRNAVNFGVVGDYFFNDRWSLRSGVVYNAMGADDGDELALNYLSIPINANWHFGSTRKWNLNFGLSPGFLVKADFNGNDIKDAVESFQLGISYGIGYKLEISEKFSLLFDAQGLVGLTDIAKDSSFSNQNAGSSLNIGAVFKL
ncbi:MAG: PorT family protein [Flavobacteriaceae bacterium]